MICRTSTGSQPENSLNRPSVTAKAKKQLPASIKILKKPSREIPSSRNLERITKVKKRSKPMQPIAMMPQRLTRSKLLAAENQKKRSNQGVLCAYACRREKTNRIIANRKSPHASESL